MDFTLSEENYLKAIFHLQQQSPSGVSTNEIAQRMKTKASSVTDMIKKLDAKGMVNYVKYRGATLTENGKIHALQVIRKHRLWEVFLVDKLDFPWDEVHEIAEQLEHIQSKELVSRLDEFLGHPQYDPHGDPIPDAQGNMQRKHQLLLAQCDDGVNVICVGVLESSRSFLQYLDQKHITIGSEIKVLGREPFDGSMSIELDGKPLFVSEKIANNLYVQMDQSLSYDG